MQLIPLVVIRNHVLKIMFVSLCITIVGHANYVIAEPLTYSPDQWPRHWNMLMNRTHLNNRMNGYRTNENDSNQKPARSPMWGVVPVTKQKSRRSLRPEYNTNSHIQNYYGQNMYRGNYSPTFSGYGYPISYGVPVMSPYGVSAMAPGLAAPGIPFGTYPYMGRFPVMGGLPGMGYMW